MGQKNYIRTDYETQLGKWFEKQAIDRLKKILGNQTVKEATSQQDLYEGTDIFLGPNRIDITLRPWQSKKAIYIKHIQLTKRIRLEVAVKVGNGMQYFDEPVVVLSFVPKRTEEDPYELPDRPINTADYTLDLLDALEVITKKMVWDEILSDDVIGAYEETAATLNEVHKET